MPAYPAPFTHDAFPAIAAFEGPPDPSTVRSDVQPLSPETSGQRTSATIRPPTVVIPVVTKLWIAKSSDNSVRSQSFNNHTDRTSAIAREHFGFAPGADTVVVGWAVTRPQYTTSVKLELFSAKKGSGPIWSKEWNDGEATTMLSAGAAGDFSGALAWTEIVIPTDTAVGADTDAFPAHVPTVQYAPYQLRMSVKGGGEAVTVAWTYFDVVVGDLALAWAMPGGLPVGDTAILDAYKVLVPGTRADVKAEDVAQAVKTEAALWHALRAGGTAPAAGNFTLALPGNSFSKASTDMEGNRQYQRHKEMWGDGPRIPMFAKVLIKTIDGENTDRCPAAVGKVKFLWDWTDSAATRGTILGNQIAHGTSRPFVAAAYDYKKNAAGAPPGADNCHFERGGKRAGAVVFPPQDASKLPFVVTAAGTRTWAAFSESNPTGDTMGWTGAVFMPSRIACDTYVVRVTFAPDPTALDTTDAASKLASDNTGLPVRASGTLQVQRKIHGTYLRKNTAVGALLTGVTDAHYLQGGIQIEWHAAGTLAQIEYNTLFGQALANPLPALKAHIDKVAPMIDPTVDQYTGGAQTDAPVSWGVTFMSWDTYSRKKKAQATHWYANDKPRKFNGLKTQYLAFVPAHKLANVGATDEDARIAFYNQLPVKKKRKVDLKLAQLLAGPDGQGPGTAQQYTQLLGLKATFVFEEICAQKMATSVDDGFTFFHFDYKYALRNPDGSFDVRRDDTGGSAPSRRSTGKQSMFLFYLPAAPTPNVMPPADVAAHEIGHMMMIVHAPAGPSPVAAFHDAGDKCLMNYDATDRHFCGLCILRLRGWSVKDEAGGVVALKNVSGQNSA